MSDSVAQPYAEYEARAADWAMCRACDKGPRAVREGRETYLPRPAGMPSGTAGDAAYDFYRLNAPFFNGYGRALSALHGMVFRKEPTIILPPAMEQWKTRATRSGRSLEQVIRSGFREELNLGRVALLPDSPARQPGRVYSVGDEERLGLTPYIVMYRAEDILELVYGMVNGRRTLMRARLRETFRAPDPGDEFKTLPGQRWRVLDLIPADGEPPREDDRFNIRPHVYRQRIYERVEGDRDRSEITMVGPPIIPQLDRGRPLDYIPLEVIDADGEPDDGDIAPPPLLDLAEHNIALYRVQADLRHGQFFSGFPQPVIKGAGLKDGEDLIIGSPVAWNLGDQYAHADAFYLSHDGKGLGSLETERQEMRRELAMLGVRMLEPDRRQVEAAETATIHRQGEMSILQSVAQLFSDGITRTVERIARWQGIEGDVRIDLNQDYVPSGASYLMVKALLEAVMAGKLPGEDWYDALKEGEVIKSGKTWEEALTLIRQEQPELLMPVEDDDEGDDEMEAAA